MPHWHNYQYVDIKLVGRSHVVAVEESGKHVIFDRDDMNKGWIHLGPTPHTRKRRATDSW